VFKDELKRENTGFYQMVEKEEKYAVRGQWPSLGLKNGDAKKEDDEEDSQDCCERFKKAIRDRDIVRY
jgi:hypothetical protein